MASSQNKFVLLDLSITVKYYVSCIRVKKYSIVAFIKINSSWILVFLPIFAYFTLFESNFIDMTLGNYGWIKTTNSKAPLFILKSWPVYYVLGI